MRVLGNCCRLSEVCSHIRVGVVGLPNVGKSSLINSLKRSHACSVEAVPGITKFMQEVYLDKFIRLLDAPSIVPGPNSEVGTILHNCIHVQQLADPVTPVETILQRCNLEEISNYYGISEFQTTEHFLTAVAHRLGKKKKGGIYSQEQAAKAVLADWVNGKISFYRPPPPTHTLPAHLSAEIVKEMTEVFDIEDTKQANEDTMECLAAGESDELLGDSHPLEMEIKWLHSSMMKIADTMENKTTMYKVPVPFLHGNPFFYPGLWEVVNPFLLVPTKSSGYGGEMWVVHSLHVGPLDSWPDTSFTKKEECSLEQLSQPWF
ncbi:guanine nucleotide-binding protein-like 3-like protein [Choloepus didactylus]|uniref:guanine nucleotide-binding protein-like 3-like protein n=1 Tax=Choloepus didactylus TaxID=27675 RepID=UPI0018A0035A|nr:guanine nucleotide-binding protein-like 3-like protein [Choloepus didactylus]